jgi:hypothetical protein
VNSDKAHGGHDEEDRPGLTADGPGLVRGGLDPADADPGPVRPDAVQPDLVRRVREICLALPEVTERPSHGSPAFYVRDKKQFVMLWPDGHHDDRFPHLWCAAPPGSQAELTAADPGRFFRPPYVGGRGWIGVRLPGGDDPVSRTEAPPSGTDAPPSVSGDQSASAWAEIAELCEDAYRAVAPAKLVALLDG